MLSFSKIMLLAGVIVAVMVVWRWLKSREREDTAEKPRRGSPKPRNLTQDMEACPACGTFVAAGTGACGRAECPATGTRR